MISHQPLSASALHHQGFLEAAVGALHHDSSSSGCTKSKHIINNHYANHAHYANYANQTHLSGGFEGGTGSKSSLSTASSLRPILP
jgi:hypothetical protein